MPLRRLAPALVALGLFVTPACSPAAGGAAGFGPLGSGGAPPATTGDASTAPVPTGAPTSDPTGAPTSEPPPSPTTAPTADAAPLPTVTTPGYSPDVQFDWPETAPGTGMDCQAGVYKGTFTGMYAPAVTLFGIQVAVSGELSITLSESADGEFFLVENGTLSGTANGSVPFGGTIQGRLDCPKKRFEANIPDGFYDLNGTKFTFSGPWGADYDKVTHQMVNGTWTAAEPGGLGNLGGTGTWQASLTP